MIGARLEYVKICNQIEDEQVWDFNLNPNQLKDNAKKREVTINALEKEKIDQISWYTRFLKIFQKGKQLDILQNIIIHGSYGDFTHTNYSDLDFTLVINEDALKNHNKLKQFREWLSDCLYPILQIIDPLQHHGPFYLWKSLAENYSEDILPIDVYENCWAFEQIDLSFKYSNTIIEPGKYMSIITLKKLTYSKKRFFARGYNMYEMKRFLSNLMLVPALYSRDCGKPVLKKDSFAKFYKDFENLARPIEQASIIRDRWPKTPWYYSFPSAISNKKMLRLFVRYSYYDRSIKRLIKEEIEPSIPLLMEIVNKSILKANNSLK